jgi:NMT1/THI5 like
MSRIAERGQRRSRGVLGVVAVSACLLATVLPAASAQAQGLKAESLKTWRQAMIIPKADAGFFLMAARRGFAEREGLKVDVLEVKDDPIGMKALLSGEVDSYEGVYGAIAASARGADVKLLGCNWHAAPYVMLARPGIGSIEELRGKSIAASSPGTPPDMVARAAGRGQAAARPGEARGGRRRPRSLHRVARRGGRRRGRVQRIHAAAGGEGHARAGRSAPGAAQVPALLHADDRQDAQRAPRGRRAVHGGADQSLPPSPIARRPSRSRARQPAPRPTTRAPPSTTRRD